MLDKLSIRVDRKNFKINLNDINVKKYDSNLKFRYKYDLLQDHDDFRIELGNISLFYYKSQKFQMLEKDDYYFITLNPADFKNYKYFAEYINLLGVDDYCKITRIDICADFLEYSMQQIYESIIGLRSRKANIYFNQDQPETIYIGKNPVMLRAYNKTNELQQVHRKTTKVDKVEKEVSRIEYQIRRPEKLASMTEFQVSDLKELINQGIEKFFKFNYEFVKIEGLDKFKTCYLQKYGANQLRKYYTKNKHTNRFNKLVIESVNVVKKMNQEIFKWYQSKEWLDYDVENIEFIKRISDQELTMLDSIKNQEFEFSTFENMSICLEKLEMLSLITHNSLMDVIITPAGQSVLDKNIERLIRIKSLKVKRKNDGSY